MDCWRDGKVFVRAGLVVALLAPNTLWAEQWVFQPTVTLEERYDDNLTLTTGPHDDVIGTILRGILSFSRLSETGGIVGRIHADTSDYSGDDRIDSSKTNIFFTSRMNHNTELSKLGFKISYKHDSTIRNIDTTIGEDTEEPVIDNDTDAGLVDFDIKRNTLKAEPTFFYQLNERSGLNLAYELTDVKYKDNISGSGLFDYDTHRVSAGYIYNLSERDAVSLTLSGSQYTSPDNNDNKVDSYEISAGYRRALTETTIGELILGVNESKQESSISSSDENGYVVRAKLERKTEQTNYLLEISHDLQPSGLGSVNETNEFDFRLLHGFSTRLKGILNMRYQQSSGFDSNSSAKNHYAIIEPGLRWNVTRWWTLSGGLRFRKNKRISNIDTADSNAVYLSIGYSKPYTSD